MMGLGVNGKPKRLADIKYVLESPISIMFLEKVKANHIKMKTILFFIK